MLLLLYVFSIVHTSTHKCRDCIQLMPVHVLGVQSAMTVLSVVQFFNRQQVVHILDSDTVPDLLKALHEVNQHFAVVLTIDNSDENVRWSCFNYPAKLRPTAQLVTLPLLLLFVAAVPVVCWY